MFSKLFKTTKLDQLILNHFIFFHLTLGVVLFFIPFSLFGQDGYMGWGPIIAEYLKGDDHFRNSLVSFGGQDLLAIYGYLPFWKIFRFLGFNFIQAENYTFWFFLILVQYYSFSLYKFFKKEIGVLDFYLVFFYTLFCPIFIHRLYAGHINLLFAILPSLVILDIMIRNSKFALVMHILTIWFAFTIQGYQLIAYNLFYIPLYYVFFKQYGLEKKTILKNVAIVLIIGLGLAIPTVYQIMMNALHSENIRRVGVNMVFSYAPMELQDLVHLFFTTLTNPFNSHKYLGFFHEITYPVSIFGLIFILQPFPKSLKLSFLFLFIFLCLFCFDLPPASWFARLPVMSAFRVPQRSFMFLSFLLPLLVMTRTKWDIHLKDLILPALCGVLFLVTPFYEVIVFLVLAIVLILMTLMKKTEWETSLIATGLLLFCLSSFDKIGFIKNSYASYKNSEVILKRAIKKFGDNPPITNFVFHLETMNPAQMNATAKILGIKTLEGYGNPPKSLIQKYESISGQKFEPGQNHLYFDSSTAKLKAELKELGINYILKL
jgi:hypothetical protein